MKDLLKTIRRSIGTLKRRVSHQSTAISPSVSQRQFAPTDHFIVTYPRSGTAWIVALISDIMVQMNGIQTDTVHPVLTTVRQSVEPDFTDPMPEGYTPPLRFVKSHWFDIINNQRLVYMFRLPADSLTSYYHFHLRNDGAVREQALSQGIDAFALEHLDEWRDHLQTAMQRATDSTNEMYFLSYESLHETPTEKLREICTFLRLDVTDKMIERAISNHTFAKSRASEEKHVVVKHEYYYRKGKVNSGKEELKPATLATIEAQGHPIYEQALTFQGLQSE